MKTVTISIEEYNSLREHKRNMETLQFIQMNPKDFQNEIINGILEIMSKPKEEEVLLTQSEVCAFYKVSKPQMLLVLSMTNNCSNDIQKSLFPKLYP